MTCSYKETNLLGLDTSVENQICTLLEDCYNEMQDSIIMQATFGRLIDTHNGKTLWMPIVTDTILPQSSAYRFDPFLDENILDDIILSTLTQSRKSWNVQGHGEKIFLETHFSKDSIIGIESLPEPYLFNAFQEESGLNSNEKSEKEINENAKIDKQYVQFCQLGKLIWFLPKSDIHIQFLCLCKKDVLPYDLSMVQHCKKSHVCNWDFHPLQGNGPSWSLISYKTSKVECAFPYKELDKKPTCCLSLRPHWPLQKPLDFTNDQFSLRKTLQFLSFQLLVHCRDIAKRLEVKYQHRLNESPSYFREYYFPGYFGDIAAESRRHYDQKKISSAKQSGIEALRRLNNEAKRTLIEKYVSKQSIVLDLACGHGQDMLKYLDQNVQEFIGVDISGEEIKEANRRYLLYQNQSKHKTLPRSLQFFSGNLLESETFEKLGSKQFDIVSIQLAIHYCIASEPITQKLLMHISEHLQSKGYFIGSTASCHFIANKLCDLILQPSILEMLSSETIFLNYPYKFGNSYYTITFTSATLNDLWTENLNTIAMEIYQLQKKTVSTGDLEEKQKLFRDLFVNKIKTTWGLKYSFWLKDHIDASEYIIPWTMFSKLMNQQGFSLVEYKPVNEFLAYEQSHNSRLREWIQNVLVRIPKVEEELQVLEFYCIFVFQKDHISNTFLSNNTLPSSHTLSKVTLPSCSPTEASYATSNPRHPSPVSQDKEKLAPEQLTSVQQLSAQFTLMPTFEKSKLSNSREEETTSFNNHASSTTQFIGEHINHTVTDTVTNEKTATSIEVNMHKSQSDTWSISSSQSRSSSVSSSSSTSSTSSSSSSVSRSKNFEGTRTFFKKN
jgi:SAM-dependent methyltransferase